MELLLINPETKTNKDLPNMALAYAATILNSKVIDLNTRPKPGKRYLAKKADLLGISIQSRAYQEAEGIKEEYQNKYPGSQVKSVQTPIDVQCCYPFVDFEEKVIVEGEFSDRLPFPDYQLFDSFEIFKNNWQNGKWSYPLMTSLGCPYQCIYCMAGNRPWRARTARNCFEELKQAQEEWGIKAFQVIDDCFSVDKARVLEFCRLVKPLKMNWFCTNGLRVDLFDEEIAQAMSGAGCRQMSFGVETIGPDLLIKIKKGVAVEQIARAVEIAKKYFPILNLYFIIGLSGSNYQKDLKSFLWAVKNKVRAHFSYFVPFQSDQPVSSSFYGRGARPVSHAYDKKLQTRLYNMAGYMRGGDKNLAVFKNVLNSFIFILLFDRKNLLSHLSNFLNIVFNRLKIRGL